MSKKDFVYKYGEGNPRKIMEDYLGRKLRKEERVHHIDGDPLNNNIENLKLCKNQSEHMKKYHGVDSVLNKEYIKRREQWLRSDDGRKFLDKIEDLDFEMMTDSKYDDVNPDIKKCFKKIWGLRIIYFNRKEQTYDINYDLLNKDDSIIREEWLRKVKKNSEKK